jgi:phage-related protein
VKDVVFIGGADDDLRSFPPTARQRAGYQLYLVQTGADPTDWKPMPTIGPGCREIRIREDSGAYRVFYVATIGDEIFVLHCFQKKTQRTAKADVDVGSPATKPCEPSSRRPRNDDHRQALPERVGRD